MGAGIAAELLKKFTAALRALPMGTIKTVVVAARFGGHPDFVQRLLLVNDDLAAVGKGQCDHATGALIVYIGIGMDVVVDAVAAFFDGQQQLFGTGHVFEVGHNLSMLKAFQILVRPMVLAACAACLWGCGQRGSLYLPENPASAHRATLPEIPMPVLPLAPAAPLVPPSAPSLPASSAP